MPQRATLLGSLGAAASVLALAVTTAAPVAAKVAPLALADLVSRAEFIGVVRVERIGIRIPFLLRRQATAAIQERWKGSSTGRLTFRASGTWTCDESDANDGEDVVAFVREGELLHDGRGRMPVFNRDGRRRVGVWSDVRLPPELRSEDNPDPNHRFSRTVDLEDLRHAVGALGPRAPAVTRR